MLTQTYTTGTANRAANLAVGKFNKFLDRKLQQKESVLAKDGSLQDLDPRDGFVQLDTETAETAGPNFYQNSNITLRTQGKQSTLTQRSAGSGLTREYQFNSNTQILKATAFSDSEDKEAAEPSDTLTNVYSGSEVGSSEFGSFALDQMNLVRGQARELWRCNGSSGDESGLPWKFDGENVYTSRSSVEHGRMTKIFGRMTGNLTVDSHKHGEIHKSFDMAHSLATDENGLPAQDSMSQTRFSDQSRKTEWDVSSNTFTVNRTFHNPDKILLSPIQ